MIAREKRRSRQRRPTYSQEVGEVLKNPAIKAMFAGSSARSLRLSRRPADMQMPVPRRRERRRSSFVEQDGTTAAPVPPPPPPPPPPTPPPTPERKRRRSSFVAKDGKTAVQVPAVGMHKASRNFRKFDRLNSQAD